MARLTPKTRASGASLAARWDAFEASLEHETGRSLDAWADSVRHLDLRPALDVLQEAGFPFEQASWIERYARNGRNPFRVADATRKGQPKRRGSAAETDALGTPQVVTARKAARMAQVHAHALLLELQASRAGDEIPRPRVRGLVPGAVRGERLAAAPVGPQEWRGAPSSPAHRWRQGLSRCAHGTRGGQAPPAIVRLRYPASGAGSPTVAGDVRWSPM